ncbi:MAG: thiamine diphosphokinase [Candidatus Izemoplasmataceae bacterium]
MIIKIFVNPINYTIENLYQQDDNQYLMGVDKGAYHALKKGLNLDLVLGDFDSTTEEEYSFIQTHAKNIKTFKERKDETDSYLAIKEALLLNPKEIIVYGGMGGRLDHTYGNLLLLKQGDITFVTDKQKMYILSPGKYAIENPYQAISFFAIEDVKSLTLQNFSYELSDYDLVVDDPLCISNKGHGTVTFKDGLLLVIHSSD